MVTCLKVDVYIDAKVICMFSFPNRDLKQQTFVSHERHLPQGNWVEDGVHGAKIKVKLPREHDRCFCS